MIIELYEIKLNNRQKWKKINNADSYKDMLFSYAFPERYNFFNLIIKIINGNDSDIGSTFNVPITIKNIGLPG